MLYAVRVAVASDGRKNPFIDAALELWLARCLFVRSFGEKNLRSNGLERVAPSNSIHHPYEGVEAFGIRICDRMVRSKPISALSQFFQAVTKTQAIRPPKKARSAVSVPIAAIIARTASQPRALWLIVAII